MADLAASEGADCGLSEKLRCDQDEPETLCSEALKAPYSHEGGGDCAEFKTKPTDAEANSSSENQKTVACAGGAPSCSTPVTVETEDAQCLSKTDIDPFIDSPESSDAASKNEEREEVKAEDAEGLSKTKDPFIESPEFVDPASKDPKERKDVKDRGSGEEKSENESGNDKASPTSDPEKEEAVLVGEVAETSALHAPAGGASCEQGKEEPGLVKPVIDSVTDSSRPDDDTGEDSDHFEDAPTGPDKDDYEGDNANSVSSPLSKEATQHDEVTGDSGQQKYEDACFELDKDKLKGDEAKPSACPVEEEQVPDSLPADSPPQHEDTSFHGPDVDPPVVAQVEKIPAVPVDEVDSTTSGEQLPDGNPDETPVVPVATPNGKGQVGEGTHVNSSCSPPQDVQGKSWADDEPLAAEPSGQKDEAIPDLEGGHEATGLPSSPGHPGDGSEEEAGEELELHATQLDELDYDSGIMESGTTGPGEEVEEEEEEDCIEGERQQGDGEESVDPSDVVDKELDFDEDKRNPQYIPKKGAFYQHDDRMVGDEEVSEVQEEKKEDDKGSQKNKKKLWQDDGLWAHDMFNADEQSPKTKEELVATYGYDIRSETMPPRARRRRRYGRGPNKYQRNWEDEDAYSARPGFGRGGGTRGGHRGRGGHGGNPSFRDEDFPDLNAKPPSSEGVANRDRTEMHVPAHKPFKGPEHRISDGPPPQQDWDHSARSSGQGRRGWGKRPQAPRRASDGSPKRPENEPVKEVAPLSQRGGSKPAPRPSLKASEPLPHGAASKVRAGKHTPTEQERNVRGGELSDKPVSKGDVKTDVKEGGNGADSKSTAVVAPRTGPLGSTETTAKPKRYSSLRQRPMAEATSYTQEPGVVAPQMASTQAPPPPPGPNPPQPAILTPAHFQGPYSPYPEGYMLPPPGQAPAVLPPQNQPPPVMAPPGQIPGSYLPAPTGLVSFPPQYPPPYTFPAQYAPPAPAAPAVSHVSGANIPQTQAQKPPYYHGDIIYYNTQSQQHKQRPTPPRRPKAAIPIVPPPDSRGGAQEGSCEPDGCVSHPNRLDEELEERDIIGAGPSVQEGLTGQQAVGGL